MCGISGIYNYRDNKPVDGSLLRNMTAVLNHRGPDGEGYYLKANVGIGHKRLSIIDLEGGSQPIFNENRDISIVFNGEIYNFPEIREELIKKGHVFYTNTDTEAIVHLYEEMGDDCVDKLRGMFAFGIWDEKKKKLFLARDRAGQKPLYYYNDGSRIVFASELKALLVDKTIKREISIEALNDYLVYLCTIAPKTIFKDIKKLCPGNVMTCTPNGVSIREYWDLPRIKSVSLGENHYIDQLNDLLSDSVSSRLISDVPLGAFLSGGLDSSTIVCMMSELRKEPPVTTSIRFREKQFDESVYARSVADHFSTEHYEEMVESDAVDQIDDIIWHLDEPFADASAIPTFNLSRAARKHVKVALSGDGGDEVFAGYRRYYYDVLENRVRKLIPEIIRRSVIGPISGIYPQAAWMPQVLRAKTFLRNISSSQQMSHFNTLSVFNDKDISGILSGDTVSSLNGYHPFSVMEKYYMKAGNIDELSKVLYVDFKTYLSDRMLVKVDRMSMAQSLEVRSPFLDHKLVEYAAGIPSELKLKGREGKYILKKIMSDRLPNEVISRAKKGFDVPLDLWFRNQLKDKAHECIFRPNAFSREFFNYDFVEKIWNEHQQGTVNWGQHLWNIYVLEIWADRVLKQ